MRIITDDVTHVAVIELLEDHIRSMQAHSPPESKHALDLEGLRASEITFWTMWDGEELLGCGALRELDAKHGEIKSMKTSSAHLRKGVAKRMLLHILKEAKARGYERVSLETGSMAVFQPACRLYEREGFVQTGPFASYKEDPNSLFFTKEL
ncbi:GNAT family N-acetyltransferase [Paenalkalicoccus suaedae]|uniref:GNAT family N-acetyltransferase n=1 Tax=Paenalkalicoccus suaedae TaxID=2592382 RepID=A0A859FKP6_9BACI|nr:GNAT family N-acetyltransferase [Paenalkalicoccus suaedae]QKS73364.1 GNAT family N-acetyltransferase [Paenalkalicoccus suaedae]